VRVAVDPRGTTRPHSSLLEDVRRSLHRYRRIGHVVSVTAARYVPLEIELRVCVAPGYFRGHVKTALLDVFGSDVLTDGHPGFFHPDRLTFGDSILASRIVTVAQAVEGVESVSVKVLQRLSDPTRDGLPGGVLHIGPLEIARLDNDPDFPEHGQLRLDMQGAL
jgi:hypothetical protein